MNEGFAPIAQEVHKARTIAVLSHVRPDGDAIGSQLALALSLSSLGKIVAAWNEDGLPEAASGFKVHAPLVFQVRRFDRTREPRPQDHPGFG